MVVVHPMDETPVQMISPLTEAGESVVGDAIAHGMDVSTVEMPPPPPISQFIPLP